MTFTSVGGQDIPTMEVNSAFLTSPTVNATTYVNELLNGVTIPWIYNYSLWDVAITSKSNVTSTFSCDALPMTPQSAVFDIANFAFGTF